MFQTKNGMGIEPEDNPKDEEVRTETYSLDFHLMTQARVGVGSESSGR